MVHFVSQAVIALCMAIITVVIYLGKSETHRIPSRPLAPALASRSTGSLCVCALLCSIIVKIYCNYLIMLRSGRWVCWHNQGHHHNRHSNHVTGSIDISTIDLLICSPQIFITKSILAMEFYPTVVRNSALALKSTCSRIGTICAPQLFILVSDNILWSGFIDFRSSFICFRFGFNSFRPSS